MPKRGRCGPLASGELDAAYEECYVAYLDILGYSKRVRDNLEPPKARRMIEKIRKALDGVRQPPVDFAAYGSRVRVLSDSVLIWCRADEEGCHTILRHATNVVGGLAFEDFWVRGAITKGWHYDDGRVLYSPAMIEAYEMESQDACYPRVLVETQVALDYQNAGTGPGAHEHYASLWAGRREGPKRIWKDHDGRDYLNYLHWIHPADLDWEAKQEFLAVHRKNIVANLSRYDRDPRIAAKYGWLASYHNRYCTEWLTPDLAAEYLIRGQPPSTETAPAEPPTTGDP